MPDIERLVNELVQQVDGCECCREEREPRISAARAALLAEYRRLADACRSAMPLTITGLQAVVKVFPEHASGFAELIPQLRAALAAATPAKENQ